MDNQTTFDRSLLLPIGVGVFSLLGICAILVMGRFNASRAEVEEVPTATSFQYAFIGTEPAISTVTLEGFEGEAPTREQEPVLPTFAPQNTPVFQMTNTPPAIITLPPLITPNTPTRTPTTAFAAPFEGGTFDNLDSRFVYNGNWKIVTGSTYQNTLHVSDNLGNSVRFLFIGHELRVFFQGGSSLGTIRLTLDNASYDLNQATADSNEWVLTASNAGTHTVTITHQSGGSVNLNYIIIPVVHLTPTNTATPTNQ